MKCNFKISPNLGGSFFDTDSLSHPLPNSKYLATPPPDRWLSYLKTTLFCSLEDNYIKNPVQRAFFSSNAQILKLLVTPLVFLGIDACSILSNVLFVGVMEDKKKKNSVFNKLN